MNKERIKKAVREGLNSTQKQGNYDPVTVEMHLRDLRAADIEMMIRDFMPPNVLDDADSEREVRRLAFETLQAHINNRFGRDAAEGERAVINEIAKDFARDWSFDFPG